MYSLLLMSALAGAPDATGFGWRAAGCTGTTSCSGYASCSGYSSCSGASSCCGYAAPRSNFLGIMDRMRSHRSAWTSCSGSSCSGSCWGSCYGSCTGSACYGSCYGSACWGSSCHGSMPAYSGCTGCTGCTGCAGYIIVGSAAGAMPVASFEPTPIVAVGKAPARLAIELPNDAKLFVDGIAIAGTGASRMFHTPELPAGQDFYYDLKAEVVVNGKTEIEETRVVVKAGERSTAKFEKLVAIAAPREVATK